MIINYLTHVKYVRLLNAILFDVAMPVAIAIVDSDG